MHNIFAWQIHVSSAENILFTIVIFSSHFTKVLSVYAP